MPQLSREDLCILSLTGSVMYSERCTPCLDCFGNSTEWQVLCWNWKDVRISSQPSGR